MKAASYGNLPLFDFIPYKDTNVGPLT